MPEIIRFRCRNCGKRFEDEVLNEDERREARRINQPVYPIRCPECKHTDLKHGWD